MGQCIDRPSSGPAPVGRAATWSFRVDGELTTWDWALGPPAVRALSHVRRPRSSSAHRHIPVQTFCLTTGQVLGVESGLEYELLLDRDRDPSVSWLVPQPCRLNYRPASGRARSHVPDLLEQRSDGSVVLWDARPAERRDDKFEEAVAVAVAACADVGWRHEVFTGHDRAHRYALRWLAAYRSPRPWHPAAREELRGMLDGGGSLGSVLEADRGAGHLVQTMWHLMWTGELAADLTQPLTTSTWLTWSPAQPCQVERTGQR